MANKYKHMTNYKGKMMAIAEIASQAATCPRKACGAILVSETNGMVLGWNGAPAIEKSCLEVGCELEYEKSCVRAVHAEVRAVVRAGKAGIKTIGSTVFSTERPCQRCLSVMAEAGVKAVYFKNDYHSGKGLWVSPTLMKSLRVEKYEAETV